MKETPLWKFFWIILKLSQSIIFRNIFIYAEEAT